MKRYSISYWVKENSGNDVEVIASNYDKAIAWCLKNLKDFKTENIKSVYAYKDVNLAE